MKSQSELHALTQTLQPKVLSNILYTQINESYEPGLLS